MKIIKSLKIEATQADVEAAIKRMVHDQDPTIVVDEIIFTQKRAGKDSISVKIEAHFGNDDDVQTEKGNNETTSGRVPEITDGPDDCPFDVSDQSSDETREDENQAQEEKITGKQSLFG